MSAAVLEDGHWKQDALETIEQLAAKGQPFDAYSLTQAGLREPPTPNQWGAAFSAANKAGLIVYVGHHRSGRKSRSGGACAQWVGKGAPQSD